MLRVEEVTAPSSLNTSVGRPWNCPGDDTAVTVREREEGGEHSRSGSHTDRFSIGGIIILRTLMGSIKDPFRARKQALCHKDTGKGKNWFRLRVPRAVYLD